MSSTEQERCPGCMGSGKCLKCGGSGHVVTSSVAAIPVISGEVHGKSETRRTCPRCMGSGRCQVCKGTGLAAAAGG
jgi:hypothetical protein